MDEQILDAPAQELTHHPIPLLKISLLAIVLMQFLLSFVLGFPPSFSSGFSIAVLGVLAFVFTPKALIPRRHFFLNAINLVASIVLFTGLSLWVFHLDYAREVTTIGFLMLGLHYLFWGLVFIQGKPLVYLTTLVYGLGCSIYCMGCLFRIQAWPFGMEMFFLAIPICFAVGFAFLLLAFLGKMKSTEYCPQIPMVVLLLFNSLYSYFLF